MLDVCLGCGGVGGEWARGRVWKGGVVLCLYEFGLFV